MLRWARTARSCRLLSGRSLAHCRSASGTPTGKVNGTQPGARVDEDRQHDCLDGRHDHGAFAIHVRGKRTERDWAHRRCSARTGDADKTVNSGFL